MPPEIRRKSISNISSLVSQYDQSTLNRAFHDVNSSILERNYITLLKSIIGKHRVQFIGDDTLLEHPGSRVMENVGWLFDHSTGNNVLAHQPVTSGLYDLETETFYPFLMRLYVKKDGDAGNEGKFRTKLEIMGEIFGIATENFNVTGKVVDSWYSSARFLGVNFTTELKSNRKVSIDHMGKMTRKNRDMFYTMDEILATTFTMFENNTDILGEFPLYNSFNAWLSCGQSVSVVVLYNPENKRKKFLASDYLQGDEIMKAWNNRWSIETFHNDAKDLGLGEYQVRDGKGCLIHGSITIAAYTLLSMMMKASKKLFGKVLKTIGECSRAVKEVLIIKKNYKSRLFSG
ncbi:Transposase, ISC1217 [mine drainage metagenome]|uniref:Transposase, ISC1217 n=1 Tax=mine drainage metagenome TaxID=410659 RepID=T1D2P5_9ZZZZ